MERIGLKNLTVFQFNKLKNELLFFDKIYFSPKIFEQSIGMIENSYPIGDIGQDPKIYKKEALEEAKSIEADISFLTKQNLLIEYNPHDILRMNKSDLSLKTKEILDKSGNLAAERIIRSVTDAENIFKLHNFFTDISYLNDALIRASKIELDKEEANLKYCPILTGLNSDIRNNITKKHQVIEMTLSKFPIPSHDVSWEKIIDFKQNEDAKLKLGRLKLWINKVANSSTPINEIEEELEQLLTEYEHRMKLEKMKYRYSNLNIILMTTAEVLENLVTLKFSKVAKTLIDLKKRNIDLLIGETKSPGKEFAYINKLKKEM